MKQLNLDIEVEVLEDRIAPSILSIATPSGRLIRILNVQPTAEIGLGRASLASDIITFGKITEF